MNNPSASVPDHQQEIVRLIKQAAYNHAEYQVFNDFLEMAAISIANAVDFPHREAREKRYLDLIGTYDKPHQQLFPEMLAHLVAGLEEKARTVGPEDMLGPIFHELELHSRYQGQFFTPQNVADMMAGIVEGDAITVKETGYTTLHEPACGSGVMIMSFCKSMREQGLNDCKQLVVTANDIDLKCVHMTYLQLSLYGIPAVVIHGNTLTLESWSRWYTPVYLLDGWIWREPCRLKPGYCEEDEQIKCALEPTYAAMRAVEALIGDTPKSAPAPKGPELQINEKTEQLSLF